LPLKHQRVLAIIPLPDATVSMLGQICELVHRPGGWQHVSDADRDHVSAVVTNGTTGLSAEKLAELPEVGLISAYGAGYENIDVAAAQARNIVVTHAPGVNDSTVADHALALTLALARDIPRRDRAMHHGGWAEIRSPRPTLTGATVGVLGLGNIGRKIAQRVQAFGTQVIYHTPAAKTDCAWHYADSVQSLAQQSRFLIVACPGGRATRHLVDASVLRSLGPDGFLINIARGEVVDTSALIEALSTGAIAGAALDVYENEPTVAAELLALDNVICTPHMAGRSPESQRAQAELLAANLRAFFSAAPLLTPVPARIATAEEADT
jgi:lactate dehydrogenase-like 2-hydroxyacid dehydrogenase